MEWEVKETPNKNHPSYSLPCRNLLSYFHVGRNHPQFYLLRSKFNEAACWLFLPPTSSAIVHEGKMDETDNEKQPIISYSLNKTVQ